MRTGHCDSKGRNKAVFSLTNTQVERDSSIEKMNQKCRAICGSQHKRITRMDSPHKVKEFFET